MQLQTNIKLVGLLGLLGLMGWMGLMGMAAANTGVTVSEYKLDNGLKIVVQEDHRAPVMVAQIWYKVGSADEHRGLTGISHALEHMMFRGTPKHPKDAYSEQISSHGGKDNAFTSNDYTAYYAEMDKSKLGLVLELEADRMQGLVLSPEDYALEIKAVREERRLRTDDNPRAVAMERFMAVAHPNGPYHHPIIGWMDDLYYFKVDDLRTWYHQWYAPNNAVLVVVGDVNPNEVHELAKKYFGAIPVKALPTLKPAYDIPPLGQNRLQVELPAQLPYLLMGYRVPSLLTAEVAWEPYALVVAAQALDGGESARFAKNIIRGQEVAAGASANYDVLQRYDTLFILNATPAKQYTIAAVEAALSAEIQKLKTELLSETELKRIKIGIMAQDVFDKDSMTEQATTLGSYESVGLPWQASKEYVAHIQAVTALQVQAVARKYFIDKRLTVAELVPQEKGK